MAKLLLDAYQVDPARRARFESEGKRGYDIDSAELSFLSEQTEQLPAGKLAGALLSFYVADGQAHYVVVQESPLTLQHVSFFDGYSIPAAHVRGLEAEDIQEHIDRAKAFAAMRQRIGQRKAPAL